MDMICGATSGVVIMTILYFLEIVSQVHGYLGGVVYLEHQAHCKMLYSVSYREPSQTSKMIMIKVNPRWKVKLKPNQFVLGYWALILLG